MRRLNVRFWPKADIGYCTAHVRFRGGVKRTWRVALHMSVFDPKQTSRLHCEMFADDPNRTLPATCLA